MNYETILFAPLEIPRRLGQAIIWACEKASERIRGARKRLNPDYVQYIQGKSKEYRQRNPLKAKSRQLFQNAVSRGRIVRPEGCERCAAPKPEAHHIDYNRAFDVLWLCKRCHEWLHHAKVKEAV